MTAREHLHMLTDLSLLRGWSDGHFIKATSIPADRKRGAGPSRRCRGRRRQVTDGCHLQFEINGTEFIKREYVWKIIRVREDGDGAVCALPPSCVSEWHPCFSNCLPTSCSPEK
ncbi:unnamed protein product [Arctogadus glacialis]